MTKEEVKHGLKCCAEYCCDECPYKIYDTDSRYPIRCMHKMILDVWKYYFDGEYDPDFVRY